MKFAIFFFFLVWEKCNKYRLYYRKLICRFEKLFNNEASGNFLTRKKISFSLGVTEECGTEGGGAQKQSSCYVHSIGPGASSW